MARDDHEGDFLLLTYREPSRDKDLATTFKAAWNGVGSPQYELESFPLPIDDYAEIEKIPAFGPFRRSDHRAFWNDNIPAIFISDTGKRCCYLISFNGRTFLKLNIFLILKYNYTNLKSRLYGLLASYVAFLSYNDYFLFEFKGLMFYNCASSWPMLCLFAVHLFTLCQS